MVDFIILFFSTTIEKRDGIEKDAITQFTVLVLVVDLFNSSLLFGDSYERSKINKSRQTSRYCDILGLWQQVFY